VDIKDAIKGQYLGGLAMLRQAIERCPEEVWTAGDHPRNFWRIAYHAIFYTHFYMGQKEEDFQPWSKHVDSATDLWGETPAVPPFSRNELLSYLDEVAAQTPAIVERLDLESSETGFPWYKNMTKLDHELMNLRHIQGHVGQLSEILLAHGIETDWIAKVPRKPSVE